jgi:hypothetical protein
MSPTNPRNSICQFLDNLKRTAESAAMWAEQNGDGNSPVRVNPEN